MKEIQRRIQSISENEKLQTKFKGEFKEIQTETQIRNSSIGFRRYFLEIEKTFSKIFIGNRDSLIQRRNFFKETK